MHMEELFPNLNLYSCFPNIEYNFLYVPVSHHIEEQLRNAPGHFHKQGKGDVYIKMSNSAKTLTIFNRSA